MSTARGGGLTPLAAGGSHTPARAYLAPYPVPRGPGPFWALDLETLNSRQRLGQTLNTLRFRVRLSEYYNFGRIEPGRHGCFLGLGNGHLRPQIIIFSRCAALLKAAPYRARRKSSLTWGAARQKRRFFTQNRIKFAFSLSSPLATAMMDSSRTLDP